MKAALPLVALLAACSQQAPAPPANEANEAAPLPAAKPAEPAAKPFLYDEKNDLIDFHYGWSAEAAAVPQLVQRLTADKNRVLAELRKGAEDERRERNREKYGLTFSGFQSSTDYTTAGQSPRLLSLLMDVGAYTGGAHGNSGTNVILWDRKAAREIQIADLFADPANMARLLTQRWCDALNKAREERRGEPVGGGGMFDDCPKLGDISIIPTDNDKNGRFERLMLVADPYVAGPYAEGSYEIDLAVTPDLVAALKADYRPSFEAQTQ